MQNFAASLSTRQRTNRQQAIQAQNTNIANGQAPYRYGFPMSPTDFSQKFGAPIDVRKHTRLTDNNDQPLIGFRFSKPIVPGLDPDVFASKALMDAGFTIDNFATALIEGDSTLQIVAHEGSNDIYIAPCKSQSVADDAARAALARFGQPENE